MHLNELVEETRRTSFQFLQDVSIGIIIVIAREAFVNMCHS